jgi:L-fuconolactonase
MKIDSHQHFWRYNNTEFGWINDEMAVIRRDFLPNDLLPELKLMEFDGSINVQARQNLDETRWLLVMADNNVFIKGVVGWVDLCSDDIENQLASFAQNPKFIGVRHVVHDEPDDNFMARDDFQHGISLLSKYKLTYDLLIFPKHLSLANELVAKFPNQKFVLDHIAKPLIKDKVHSPWDKDIAILAKNPNVYCKLSGIVTEADWKKWKPSDFQFYLDTIFDAFGEDRIMIGSDWPVCNVAGTYHDIMKIVIDYFEKKNGKISEKILGENCVNFYLKNK